VRKGYGSLKIQYNRNRYYDYYTGRWLTHDPLGINPADGALNPLSIRRQYKDGMSLYEYVHSSPGDKKLTKAKQVGNKKRSAATTESGSTNLMTLILCLCLSLQGTILAANSTVWSLEVRIAADPNKDVHIVKKARSSPESELYDGASLVAKWVPVMESKAFEFLGHSGFAIRRNTNGQVELLVLISEADLTERDVSGFDTTLDGNGRRAVLVTFNDTGRPKLLQLTRDNFGRQVAQVINGKVWNAPYIRSTLRTQAVISGDFTTLEKMLENSPFQLKPSCLSPPRHSITITPLRIVLLLAFVLLIVLACFPAHGLNKSRYPRSWIVVGLLLGLVAGGYWFGVTKSVAGPDSQGDIPPWADIVEVRVPHVLLGAVVGGLFGIAGGYLARCIVRRAVHNAIVLCKLVIMALLPPKVRAAFGTLPGAAQLRRLNKKQLVVLFIGLLAIFAFILFPPWAGSTTKIITEEFPEGYAGEEYKFIGFRYLFSGEDVSFDSLCIMTRIDYGLLGLLCSCTAILCGLLMFFLRTHINKKSSETATI
jgi:hypothetical protein